jgi:hypothetical protein
MPGPDSRPNLFTDSHQAAPYTRFTMRIRYLYDDGRLQLPIAAPPPVNRGDVNARPKSSIVRTHAPASRASVEWTATRLGAAPDLPHPEVPEQARGWFLTSAEIVVEAAALQADGLTQEFKVSGVYVYLMDTPVWAPTDAPSTGSTPYDVTSPGAISPSQFKGGWL